VTACLRASVHTAPYAEPEVLFMAQSNMMTDQIAAASASGSGVSDPGTASPAATLAARLDAIGGIQGQTCSAWTRR
jgi:hypothetical protein